MNTATHQTAIEFLVSENKALNLDVYDYLSETDFFVFNRKVSGSENFEVKNKDLDWDEFSFTINANINFDFSAWHRTRREYEPEEKQLEIDNISAQVEIVECYKWDDEYDEMKEYRLSHGERKQIEKYLSEHVTLND